MLDHFKARNLSLWASSIWLAKSMTSKYYNVINATILSLIEHNNQAQITAISVQPEWFGIVCTGQHQSGDM